VAEKIVIVPHQSQELILIKEQKELIKALFCKERLMYAVQPLWIMTSFESVDLAKKSITSVLIEKPCYDKDENQIFCPVTIQSKASSMKSKLPLIKIMGTILTLSQLPLKKEELFPLSLKIFRLGEYSSTDGVLHELSASCWKKLKDL